ncbi:zinc ribbon domain-containing protein [Candidatus Microgenomates bacterium]|nr:zinc ribbon domain-containing protein [Candidatus Microgenomates bacterium]
MNCKECRKRIESGSKFCDNCGARVGDGSKAKEPRDNSPLAIDVSKLLVMSFLTFGIYEIYWFYKQWKFVKNTKTLEITPWARALFAPLFAYQLFKHVFDLSKDKNGKAGWLAIGYFIFVGLSWKLPDPWWLLSLGNVAFLIPIQNAMNEYLSRETLGIEINSSYSPKEIAILVIGGLVTAPIIIGALFPGKSY